MRTSLMLDPQFVAALDALDVGVFDGGGPTHATEPPLRTLLVMPPLTPMRAARYGISGMTSQRNGFISVWAASWLLLATCLSVSVAGFAYHNELSDLLARWEDSRPVVAPAPQTTMPTALPTIEIASR
ncbi:MAG TPA: hypothetical protein VJP86_12805 [Vicinamibacterales bacterium]|nr:hypothetical protein [Vicinamibacterales bacterium]